MSAASLSVGAKVFTDFTGKITQHTIVEIVRPAMSSSGIGFFVTPPVPKSSGGWLCADWFEPNEAMVIDEKYRSLAQPRRRMEATNLVPRVGGNTNSEQPDRPTPTPQALSHDTEAGKKASKA